ncbi:MAG: ABC transporter ATP-binding protein [Candidatus Brocadiia bacterium]
MQRTTQQLNNPATDRRGTAELDDDVVLSVRNVSKKFCKTLRRSMAYGIMDMSKNLVGIPPDSSRLRKGEFWALRDVSFELRRGDTLGLIGLNGSGKTTLLRLVAGIFPPDKGQIAIRGRVGALIALGAGFHPHMTGRENIYLNGSILGLSRRQIDRQFDDIVEFSELEDFVDTPVSAYSSGMKVRLGFSIAIHINPDLLLIDEVLAVGDAAFRRKCQERLTELLGSGVTFIFVSHHMQAVRAITDQAMLLDKGRVIAFGDTADVVAEYDLRNRPELQEIPTGAAQAGPGELRLVKRHHDYEKGDIRVDSVWLEDDQGRRRSEFGAGEACDVCVRFRAEPGTPLDAVVVQAYFKNEYDVVCNGTEFFCSESESGRTLPGEGILRVRFAPLALATGTYRLCLHFHEPSYLSPYSTGEYGYFSAKGPFATKTPGVNTPVCYGPCEWSLESADLGGAHS